MLEEIGDKSPLHPAMIASNSSLSIAVSGGSGVEHVVRETAGEIFVLACKREGNTAKVEFSGFPAGFYTAEVLYEPPRAVAVVGGRFTDWFGPFDVHVYRFKKPVNP